MQQIKNLFFRKLVESAHKYSVGFFPAFLLKIRALQSPFPHVIFPIFPRFHLMPVLACTVVFSQKEWWICKTSQPPAAPEEAPIPGRRTSAKRVLAASFTCAKWLTARKKYVRITHVANATVAQWQSISLVMRRLSVRFWPVAPTFGRRSRRSSAVFSLLALFHWIGKPPAQPVVMTVAGGRIQKAEADQFS